MLLPDHATPFFGGLPATVAHLPDIPSGFVPTPLFAVPSCYCHILSDLPSAFLFTSAFPPISYHLLSFNTADTSLLLSFLQYLHLIVAYFSQVSPYLPSAHKSPLVFFNPPRKSKLKWLVCYFREMPRLKLYLIQSSVHLIEVC